MANNISMFAIVLGALLLGSTFFSTQSSLAEEPSPDIKFEGLDEEGCKKFTVKDFENKFRKDILTNDNNFEN